MVPQLLQPPESGILVMSPQPDSLPQLRILLVEDDADTADSLALVLRLYGHDVDVAMDGPTALRMAKDRPPDVALLDLGLPGGMDGWETAWQLRNLLWHRKPLLIAVTGHGQPPDRRRSANVGIHLHLVKPVDTEDLRWLLERIKKSIGK